MKNSINKIVFILISLSFSIEDPDQGSIVEVEFLDSMTALEIYNYLEPMLDIFTPLNGYDVDIYSDEYDTCNIKNLNNFTKMKCDIYIDKIWKFNEQFICKWKAKVIYLV